MNYSNSVRYAVIAFILTFLSMPGYAAEVTGIKFNEAYAANGKNLRLIGAGLLRYWGFKAYVGALYLEEDYPIEDVLADRAKRLEIEYLRPIKGKDFGPATEKGIKKNVDSATYNRLRDRIRYQNSLYEDVRPGDRYSLTYIPGRGTELSLNGVPKGIVEGAEFAAAIFSIWIGPKPISAAFRRQLLGI